MLKEVIQLMQDLLKVMINTEEPSGGCMRRKKSMREGEEAAFNVGIDIAVA